MKLGLDNKVLVKEMNQNAQELQIKCLECSTKINHLRKDLVNN